MCYAHQHTHRKFDQLTAIMHEDNNWSTYRQEIEKKQRSNSSFVPFLGVFLTTAAFYQTASTSARSFSMLEQRRERAADIVDKKVSVEESNMYETYHLLEAITVRQKLEKLRESSIGEC